MDTKIYGSAWYSDAQNRLRTSLTIGYTEYILSPQKWQEIASIAQQMIELHEQLCSPEIDEQNKKDVIAILKSETATITPK